MMMPVMFRENFFDDFFPKKSDFERKMLGRHPEGLMKTDVQEKDGKYEISVELPGFSKEDLNIVLEDGYLTVSAEKKVDDEKKDKDGKIIRQERYFGSMSRSFYIGDGITEEDIKAKLENGVLNISVPKKQEEIPEKKTIAIE